jgi:hypothetical protein
MHGDLLMYYQKQFTCIAFGICFTVQNATFTKWATVKCWLVYRVKRTVSFVTSIDAYVQELTSEGYVNKYVVRDIGLGQFDLFSFLFAGVKSTGPFNNSNFLFMMNSFPLSACTITLLTSSLGYTQASYTILPCNGNYLNYYLKDGPLLFRFAGSMLTRQNKDEPCVFYTWNDNPEQLTLDKWNVELAYNCQFVGILLSIFGTQIDSTVGINNIAYIEANAQNGNTDGPILVETVNNLGKSLPNAEMQAYYYLSRDLPLSIILNTANYYSNLNSFIAYLNISEPAAFAGQMLEEHPFVISLNNEVVSQGRVNNITQQIPPIAKTISYTFNDEPNAYSAFLNKSPIARSIRLRLMSIRGQPIPIFAGSLHFCICFTDYLRRGTGTIAVHRYLY